MLSNVRLGLVVLAVGGALSPLAARSRGDEAASFSDPDGHVLVLAKPLVTRNP